MTEKLIPYDGTRYLDDEEDIALYLGFALEALHKLLADAGITPTPTTSEAPAPQKAPALAEA